MAGKRELINTGTDKRYVSEETRRVSSKSPMMLDAHSQDVRRKAKTVVRPGYGDKGDQKRK